MGLILRSTTTPNAGTSLSIKSTPLTYAEGDGNFMYLLTNMSGSNTITGDTTLTGNLTIPTGYSLLGTASYTPLVAGNGITVTGMTIASKLLKVNGNDPGSDGNVTVSLTGVITGLSSSLIVSSSGNYTASFTTGSIWVVSGETATAFTSSNGRAYIFTTTGSPSRGVWQQIAPLDQTAADARYLQLAGGTMNGNISFNPTYKLNGTASWAESASNAVNSLTASYITSSRVYGPYGLNSIVSASYASGSTSASYALTASYALNAGAGTGFPFSGSAVITGSLLISGSGITITGSLNVSGGITGSLFGTSSWAQSSSIAISSSYALSSSYVVSSSYALSSSYVVSSSYSTFATSASYASGSTSASYALTASYALNASSTVLNLIASGSVTASVDVSNTTFQLISGSTTMLFVSKSGNVGIGTTTPAYKLDISGSININISSSFFRVIPQFYTGNTGIRLELSSDGPSHIMISGSDQQGSTILAGYAQGAGQFFTNAVAKDTVYRNISGSILFGNTTGSAAMAVSASRVGIGTVSPAYKLDISGSGDKVLRVFGSGSSNPIVSVQGSLGELFSVTDSLSGSLFSVNDISGLPILEVFSDNTTLIGGYSAPALNTTVKTTITTGVGQIIYQVPTSSYDAIFVDYIAESGSSGNIGNFMATYSGSTAYSTFTSSSYIGGASFRMNAIVTGSNLAITGSATTTGWTVKTIIRSI